MRGTGVAFLRAVYKKYAVFAAGGDLVKNEMDIQRILYNDFCEIHNRF